MHYITMTDDAYIYIYAAAYMHAWVIIRSVLDYKQTRLGCSIYTSLHGHIFGQIMSSCMTGFLLKYM